MTSEPSNELNASNLFTLDDESKQTELEPTKTKSKKSKKSKKKNEDDNELKICRICSLPSTINNKLYHPCLCKGSLRYVHQSCLSSWLSVSNYVYKRHTIIQF